MKRSLLFFASLLTTLGTSATLLAQDDTATRVAAAATHKTSSVTLLHLIETGGWSMIPLAIMSVLTLMLIIGYALTLRRGAIVSPHFMITAEELLKRRDYTGLLTIANRHGESIARIMRRTLDFASKNPSASFEVVRDIAQTEGATQAGSLQHRITYLADIAVLSPMVGLLGTVFGIIHSFGVLASNASQASRPVLLAQGVSEALVATGSGLIVGIISMAFYGLFRNKVQSLIGEMESAATHLLSLMAIHFDKREPRQGVRRDDRPGDDARERHDDLRDRERERERQRERERESASFPAQKRRPAVSVDDEF